MRKYKHWRQKLKRMFAESFGNKCCVCKKTYPLAVYDFHHLDPAEKKFTISQAWRGKELLLEEIKKCVMVCSNCHRLVETNQAEVPRNAVRFTEKNYRQCEKIL
jgi:hypothetical protein